jgi:hypothetical protein
MLDLTNKKFNRLTVDSFVGRDNFRDSVWSCVCDCGNIVEVTGGNLKKGNTKSCGCLKKEVKNEHKIKHGHTQHGVKSKVYTCWISMIQRCYNPNRDGYKNYGGRGIKVCERWHTFENFYNDMGDCPEGLTLDREDNNKDYTPENCRWATNKEQSNNTRRNHRVTYKGETKTLSQWAQDLGINKSKLRRDWIKIGIITPLPVAKSIAGGAVPMQVSYASTPRTNTGSRNQYGMVL